MNHSFDYLKNEEELDRVRKVVAAKPMEKLLFELSISSGLRLKEILCLTVNDVAGGSPMSSVLTPAAREALDSYLAGEAAEGSDYLFHKKNDAGRPLSVPYVSNLVTKWFDEALLDGHYAARSLYKTYEHLSSAGAETGSKFSLPEKKQPTLRENQIYELLFGSIISGGLPVNTYIKAGTIAAEMNSSSAVVRAALNRLEDIRLVEHVSSQTYKVKAYSEKYISELFDLRLLLECHAYDHAVQNWDDGIVTGLQDLLDRWKAVVDTMNAEGFSPRGIMDCVHYHSAFHAALYSPADLPVTVNVIEELAGNTDGFHLRHYFGRENHIEEDYRGIADHQVMVDALRVRDFEACRRLLTENIKQGCEICLASIRRK